jgi:hypothetical protein
MRGGNGRGLRCACIDAAIDALASVSKCSVRQVDLWALVDDRVRLKDDFEAVRRLNLTLAECRTIMHQYHRVRADHRRPGANRRGAGVGAAGSCVIV